jgi:hypothetical protein
MAVETEQFYLDMYNDMSADDQETSTQMGVMIQEILDLSAMAGIPHSLTAQRISTTILSAMSAKKNLTV